MSTTPNAPEPKRQPATPSPGQMRAADADRDLVAELLGAAYAEGRLTREEHDQRMSKAMEARTFDDLVPLTADLTASPATAPQSPLTQPSGQAADMVYAVFSSAKRTGDWHVQPHTSAMSLFGSINLDMRQSPFTAQVVEVNTLALFGSVDIRVPAGVRVRNDVVSIFGSSEVKRLSEPTDGAPTIVVKGMALFGSVTVKGSQ